MRTKRSQDNRNRLAGSWTSVLPRPELTKRCVAREFFASHTVSELNRQGDYGSRDKVDQANALSRRKPIDMNRPVGMSRDDAFALARELRGSDDPSQAELYASR
jgi:hypothetical protein